MRGRRQASTRGTRDGDTAAGRVYGYVRLSVVNGAAGARQSTGESLDVQRRKLEGWAMQTGRPLAHVYVERNVSGSRPLVDRPQGQALLAALQPGDVVVASKLDRLFRDAFDAQGMLKRLRGQGVGLIVLDLGPDSITSNGVSALVFGILSSVAEFERLRIRERILENKARLREGGRFLGGSRPFGYRIDAKRRLVPLPREQRAIVRMRRLAKAGKSYRAISAAVQARDGLTLSHLGVRRILAGDRGSA